MSEYIERNYPSVDMNEVGKTMRKLHDQVVSQRHRIHVTRDDCDDVCIMISKCELESLEQALAIFADSEAFNEMCTNIQQLLKTAGMIYSPQVYDQTGGSGAYAD